MHAGSTRTADLSFFFNGDLFMKKILFICLVQIIWPARSLAGQPDVDIPVAQTTSSYELKGPVLSLHERQFIYTDGEPKRTLAREIQFDKMGRMEIAKELKMGEKDHVITRYGYNDAGRLLSEATINGSKGYDSAAFIYNHAGDLRKRIFFDAGKVHQTTRYNYRNGKLSYIRIEDGNSQLINMIRFRYSGNHEYRRIVLDGSLKYLYSELFTEKADSLNARQWSCYFYPAPDSCSGQVSLNYNAEGKLVEDITIGPEKRVQQYITNTYNVHGLPDEQVVFTDKKRTIGYTYRFDSKGNWIERSTYSDGKVRETTTRMITYREQEDEKNTQAGRSRIIIETN